jgi:hypothetical protein
MPTEPVYEMNWDCPRCDTRGLLGKTHRYCPACGAPQDPTKRYFPPDDQKVAVADHVYVGVDRSCPQCETPNAAKAQYCTSCGGPMEGVGREVARVDEAPPPAPAPPPRAGGAGKKGCLGCGALLALLLVVGLGLFLADRLFAEPARATVSAQTWTRSVEIEQYGTQRDEGWCDALPSGARETRRVEKERSSRKEKDGQDCKVRKVDQGDGTFREVEECQDRFREVPVTDAWCSYEVERWATVRTEQAQGSGASPAPSWPASTARTCPRAAPGCEREGSRREDYVAVLRTADGESHDCSLPAEQWARMTVGSHWTGASGLIGGLRCDSLQAAP